MAQWRLLTWLQGLDLHRIVASALEKDSDAASHVFLCGLRSRGELTQLLQSKVVFESLVNVLWTHVGELQQAGTADGSDDRIASKFSGAVELSYSGLDTFFNGLEGVVGAPSPNVYDSMATEHVNGPDSVKQFVTGNYGIQTTSQIEWLYVVGEGVSCDQLGLTCWPKESEEKLAIHHHRTRRPLANIQRAAETRNEQLRRAGHLLLITEELISANMYTGPLFVKYNAVLRGLQTDVPFLLSTMVSLCCPEAVARGYAVGSVTIDEAKSSLNTYTTTLHAINSAVIKLGKLTKATKVYRGIAGMALPAEFWTPNEVGVRGGVENAFMSTTLERDVALGYAQGDGIRMGIVLEAQQGMVSRGADITWLSQYAHEREILFGPLTGIEVLSIRMEGSVVIIECAFSVCLVTRTLEQVLNKRHGLVKEMGNNIVLEVPAAMQGTGINADTVGDIAAELEQELAVKVLHSEATAFNDDSHFVHAVQMMMKLKHEAVGAKRVLTEMQKLDPGVLVCHAAAVVARLGQEDMAIEMLARLPKGDLAHICKECLFQKMLADEEPQVRAATARVLSHLDTNVLADWAPSLMPLLCDPSESVECSVLDTLSNMAPADLVEYEDSFFCTNGGCRISWLSACSLCQGAVQAGRPSTAGSIRAIRCADRRGICGRPKRKWLSHSWCRTRAGVPITECTAACICR